MKQRTGSMLHSHLRVMALADVAHRYGTIVRGLADAISAVTPDVDPDVRLRLERALDDVAAQLAAADDALTRAVEDLPEGGAS